MAGKDEKDKAGKPPFSPFPASGAFGKPPPMFQNLQDGSAARPAEPPRTAAGDASDEAAKGADAPSPFANVAARAPELKATLGRFGRDALGRLNAAGATLRETATPTDSETPQRQAKPTPQPDAPKARGPAAESQKGAWARYRRGLIVFVIGAWMVFEHARRNVPPALVGGQPPETFLFSQLGANALAAVAGLILGLVPVLLMTRFRDIGLALLGVLLLYFIFLPVVGTGMVFFTGAAAVVGGIALGMWWFGKEGVSLPETFGTSRWAKLKDLTDAGLTGEEGFRLGTFREGKEEAIIRYAGSRHLLTVAPTRAGKGVAAIVPNLLTYRGSALVIDPKGENALITAKRRVALGQAVHLLDPWNIAAGKLGMKPARFNPLDMLRPDDPDLVENANLIADALVVSSGGANDRFWDDEARAMIVGLILWVVTAPHEEGKRTLGRVRDLLVLEPKELFGVFGRMIESAHPVVESSGTRAMQKEEKVFSNVLATAQSHTNMLDSPRIRESLSGSDLSFADLKAKPSTVFLILPADRLDTYGRWLRLLVQQAILVNARNIEAAPARPILFLLDEMAALGRLTMVEQAFGLMAGFGMQLWGIVQDLSQLRRLYGDGWETFIGNSGVLQYFGSRDRMTAEYFSALCGVATVWNISTAVSSAMGGGSRESESRTTANAQRSLAYPDELMTLRQERQLLFVENGYPILADKTPWFADPALKGLGNDLHKPR